MRNLVVVAVASLLVLSLAGCADDKERAEGVPSSTSASASATATATGTATATSTGSSTQTSTSGEPNQPPTGTIGATINGTSAVFELSGTDPDGDALAWDLDFGDGNATSGTTLPATVEHAYAPGNFTAIFTITDGNNPVTYSANLTFGGGSSQQTIFSGTMLAPDPSAQTHVHCLQALAEHEGAPAPGVDVHAIDPSMWGGAWVLTGDGIKAQFEDWANAVLLAEGTSGEVPEGTDFVHICSETAVNTPYVLTIDY